MALPGLLFHHMTPTKVWFHDLMIPWVHFVPVSLDLSDLRQKFIWAESHPEEVGFRMLLNVALYSVTKPLSSHIIFLLSRLW